MYNVFSNIDYLDKGLYDSVKSDADKKFGLRQDNYSKQIWIINEYSHRNGYYKINPKRRLKHKDGYLSRVKRLKPYQAKMKMNVSKKAQAYIIQQEAQELVHNKNLTELEKNWLMADLEYFSNTTEKKVWAYIAAKNSGLDIQYLDKKSYQDLKQKSEEKFGPQSSEEIRNLWTLRTYNNMGLPVKFGPSLTPQKVEDLNNLRVLQSGTGPETEQGLPSGEDTWKGINPNDDLRFKSQIESEKSLSPQEKADMLIELKNLQQKHSEMQKSVMQDGYEFKTFMQFPN